MRSFPVQAAPDPVWRHPFLTLAIGLGLLALASCRGGWGPGLRPGMQGSLAVSGEAGFGSTPYTGEGIAKSFTIRNSTTATIRFPSPAVSLSGSGSGQFKVITQPAGDLAPGRSTTVQVRFTPTAAGDFQARLEVVAHGAKEEKGWLDLQGTGRLPTWTFAVYMAADNDLAMDGLINFGELAEAGSSAEVRIVVQAEFGKDYLGEWGITQPGQTGLIGFDTYRYYMRAEHERDNPGEFLWEEVRNGADMGSGAALRDWLIWVKTRHPAEHTCLVVWNHGSGWEGACQDDSADNGRGSWMTLAEFRDGLDAARIGIDVLDFDACLMGMYETAFMARGRCDHLVASEGLEPGLGNPYPTIVAALKADPAMSPATFAATICDHFVASYGDADVSVTKSAVNMASFDALHQAIETVATALTADLDRERPAIEAARAATQPFQTAGHLDLADFLDQVVARSADPGVVDQARSAAQATRAAITRNRIGSRPNSGRGQPGLTLDRAYGLAAFIPDRLPDQGDGSLEAYQQYAGSSGPAWSAFVAKFMQGGTLWDVEPYEFGVMLVWRKPQTGANVDLWVREPHGEYAAPWMGTVSDFGFLSGDDGGDATAAIALEFYTCRPWTLTGRYDFFAVAYDLAGLASVQVDVYVFDVPNGWTDWTPVGTATLSSDEPFYLGSIEVPVATQ